MNNSNSLIVLYSQYTIRCCTGTGTGTGVFYYITGQAAAAEFVECELNDLCRSKDERVVVPFHNVHLFFYNRRHPFFDCYTTFLFKSTIENDRERKER